MKLPKINVYVTSYFENNKQKSSDIWNGIRSLVNIKSSDIWKGIRSLINIKYFKSSFKLLDNDHNLISDHFATIGSAIEQKIRYAYH